MPDIDLPDTSFEIVSATEAVSLFVPTLYIDVAENVYATSPYTLVPSETVGVYSTVLITGDGDFGENPILGEGIFGAEAAGEFPKIVGAGLLSHDNQIAGAGTFPIITGTGETDPAAMISSSASMPLITGHGHLLGDALIAGSGIMPRISGRTVADANPAGGGIGAAIYVKGRFDDYILRYTRD